MTKITVHRALAELKTVEKRINKKICNKKNKMNL